MNAVISCKYPLILTIDSVSVEIPEERIGDITPCFWIYKEVDKLKYIDLLVECYPSMLDVIDFQFRDYLTEKFVSLDYEEWLKFPERSRKRFVLKVKF